MPYNSINLSSRPKSVMAQCICIGCRLQCTPMLERRPKDCYWVSFMYRAGEQQTATAPPDERDQQQYLFDQLLTSHGCWIELCKSGKDSAQEICRLYLMLSGPSLSARQLMQLNNSSSKCKSTTAGRCSVTPVSAMQVRNWLRMNEQQGPYETLRKDLHL